MRNHRVRDDRFGKKLRIRVNHRHPQRLFVKIEHLLALAAVSQPHLAVVGGPNDQGVFEQPLFFQRVQHLDEVTVLQLHQVAIEAREPSGAAP